MIRSIPNEVWAFDCQWVPDVASGRILYNLPNDCPIEEVLHTMWIEGGATEEDPQPFLRLIFCRVVSIAMVIRHVRKDKSISLLLKSLPADPDDPELRKESSILKLFLEDGIGSRLPQLVGFNSRNADLRILEQRALIKGMTLPSFSAQLASKPWDQTHIDLMDMLCRHGNAYSASLNEIAMLSGIPGEIDISGKDICNLWYQKEYRKIYNYNNFKALSIYLLWLRAAFFSGKFTKDQYSQEQAFVRQLIMEEIKKPNGAYLQNYLDTWNDLQKRKSDAEFFSE